MSQHARLDLLGGRLRRALHELTCPAPPTVGAIGGAPSCVNYQVSLLGGAASAGPHGWRRFGTTYQSDRVQRDDRGWTQRSKRGKRVREFFWGSAWKLLGR